MTPAAIIQQAEADGVHLVLLPDETIIVRGAEAAVERWIPTLRARRDELVDELRAANDRDLPLSDPAAEARRQRLLKLLVAVPDAAYMTFTDSHSDPDSVILSLAIRGKATGEILIPRDRFDEFDLLDMVGRHFGTKH